MKVKLKVTFEGLRKFYRLKLAMAYYTSFFASSSIFVE